MCPGRYLTFSCSVLMISVNFRPPTSSSYTHMLTVASKRRNASTLWPTIPAMVEPLRQQRGAGAHEPLHVVTSHYISRAQGVGNPPKLRNTKQEIASLRHF